MNSFNENEIENCLKNLKNESLDFSLINEKSSKLLHLLNEQTIFKKKINGN
jgi:hypothetical protein